MNVGVDAGLVGLERRPIDEPGMVFGKQYGPLGHGQMTGSSSEHSRLRSYLGTGPAEDEDS